MIDKVTRFIDTHNLVLSHSTLIIGLSGGPDSVCLLHLLVQLQAKYNLTLIAAHLDHQWRKNSQEDASFCKQLAQALSLPFITAKASQIEHPVYNGSQEEQARHLRHIFFKSVVHEYKADAVVLAHHKDDQMETFFVRLIRGASIAGLAGIKPQERIQTIPYIRPLLTCSKNEIISYLTHNNIPSLSDPTNEDDNYLRNALRLRALPALKKCDSRFDRSFEKAHVHLKQTEEFLQRLTKKTFAEITQSLDNELWLSLEKFFACDSFLQHRVIVAWLCAVQVPFTPSTRFFDEIVRFFKNSAQLHEINRSWSIVKKAHQVTIKKLPSSFSS